jgi:hypothetical protein
MNLQNTGQVGFDLVISAPNEKEFNVITKIAKNLEIWNFQIFRNGIWPCPALP